MSIARPDRLWLAGGALGAVALILVGWFFLIGPSYDQKSDLEARVNAARSHQSKLEHRLTQLERQQGDLPKYQATLEADREALPSAPELSDFLRELHAAGTQTKVSVSGLVVGSPVKADHGVANVLALPVTMTAIGPTDGLIGFLDQIQRERARAVLIESVTAVPEGQAMTLTDSVTTTISLRIFVAATAERSTPK